MTPTAAPACQCARCRVHAASLAPGPYTPSEYARIAPPVLLSPSEDDVGADTEVIDATRARDEARVAFDACDSIWLAAVAAHQSAVLLGADPYLRDAAGDIIGRRAGPRAADRGRIAELAAAELEAGERRDRAWAQVVKANDKILAAQYEARLAAAEAARNGQNGNKGRRG